MSNKSIYVCIPELNVHNAHSQWPLQSAALMEVHDSAIKKTM